MVSRKTTLGLLLATLGSITALSQDAALQPPEQAIPDVVDFYLNQGLRETNQKASAAAPMHVHEFTVNETYDTIYAAGHGKLVAWTLTD
ncbi:MAG: hypothetical protein OSB47_16690 [Pirellulaceae bacterium]|nr:hypothetical protein [Pirellulaceae bacterium]